MISAVIAAVTAAVAGGSWLWQQTADPDTKSDMVRATDAPLAVTPGAAATAPVTPAPATPLDGIALIGGEVTALPENLSAADYSRPVTVACPSNQTGDQSRTLTYDLDRRYRTFTATVSGQAESGDGDAIEVRVFTRTRQKDDSFLTRETGSQGGGMNETGRELSAQVTTADQMLVEVGCHRPGGVVILDQARLGG